MNKKIQVYLSSTYSDLIEERQVAIKAILDAGHIPAGMEALIPIDESYLNTLYNWIDESDIYILLLGGRYGAIEEQSGKSYTQLEYEYASSKNMPVITIVLEDDFLLSKSHLVRYEVFEKNNRKLYKKFKSLTMKNIVKFVKNITDIQVVIHKILKECNILESSIGWVRPHYDNNINNFVQELYKQNSFILNSIFNDENKNNELKHYFDIYNSYNIKSISNVTTNKCIVDPLGNPLSDIKNIRIDVSEVNDWMLNELNKNPTDLYKLSPRRFEELIAEVLIRKGYSVKLTPATRDGGKDIYVASKDDLGSFLYLVECKHYEPTHKVGVSVIRDLYGVLSKEKATYGIVVTTSNFTKPAQEFQQDIKFQMSLKNFNSIQKWICDVT